MPGDPSLGHDPGFENPYVHYSALKILWDKSAFILSTIYEKGLLFEACNLPIRTSRKYAYVSEVQR